MGPALVEPSRQRQLLVQVQSAQGGWLQLVLLLQLAPGARGAAREGRPQLAQPLALL